MFLDGLRFYLLTSPRSSIFVWILLGGLVTLLVGLGLLVALA